MSRRKLNIDTSRGCDSVQCCTTYFFVPTYVCVFLLIACLSLYMETLYFCSIHGGSIIYLFIYLYIYISPHYFRKIHICFYARIYLSAALRHIYLGNAYLLLCVRSLQKIAIFIFLYIQWIYERDVEDILVYEIDISLRTCTSCHLSRWWLVTKCIHRFQESFTDSSQTLWHIFS